MELGGLILSEVTQVQKEKKENSMFSFIWNPIILWSGGRECINKYAHGYNMILRQREGSKFR